MTTELAKREGNGDLAAVDFSDSKVALLKRTICNGATDNELELFIHACKRTGLDPFMRQIHAVFRFDKRVNRKVMSIQTGIDGYRLIADRTGRYAGNDDPRFKYTDEGGVIEATAKVYKLVGGERYPFEATARWDEYYPGDGDPGFMWRKMPHVMLGKVAEALALRKAFPAELSGVYTADEMAQAGNEAQAAPVQAEESPAVEPSDGPMADDDEFRTALMDAFTVQKFTPEQSDAATEAVLGKHKVKSITDLPLTKRQSFIAAVAGGKLNKFKTTPEPAGTSA